MVHGKAYLKRQVPEGTRDVLPLEAAGRKRLTERFLRVMDKWGYREVMTPAFEYLDVLEAGSEGNSLEKMYKFFDHNGNILALRSDITTPVARMVATRMKDYQKPLRLSYTGHVFRYDELQVGKQRQFEQTGLELVGVNSPEADAEVIAIAIEALQNAGLKDFQISLGQVEFFRGVLGNADLSEEVKEEMIRAVDRKDFFTLGEILDKTGITAAEKELLTSVPQLYGKKEVLTAAQLKANNDHSKKALANIRSVYEILEDYGLSDYIFLDLGLVRGIDYYTGMVFKVYTQGIGFSLGGGGRYDNLAAEFGPSCPAVGFAFSVGRILYALEKKVREPLDCRSDCRIEFAADIRREAWNLAKELRLKGLKVELALNSPSELPEASLIVSCLKTGKELELKWKEGLADELFNSCFA